MSYQVDARRRRPTQLFGGPNRPPLTNLCIMDRLGDTTLNSVDSDCVMSSETDIQFIQADMDLIDPLASPPSISPQAELLQVIQDLKNEVSVLKARVRQLEQMNSQLQEDSQTVPPVIRTKRRRRDVEEVHPSPTLTSNRFDILSSTVEETAMPDMEEDLDSDTENSHSVREAASNQTQISYNSDWPSLASKSSTQQPRQVQSSKSREDFTVRQSHPSSKVSTQRTESGSQPIQTSSSNAAAEEKVPPIVLRDPGKWPEVRKYFDTHQIRYTKARSVLNGISISPTSIDDHRNIIKLFKSKQLPCHTYQLPDDKLLRVVIRNVPIDLSEKDISVDLAEQGFEIVRVIRMSRTRDKISHPLPMVLVHLPRSQYNIFKITHLMGLIVIIEPQKAQANIGQCFNCQLFGHAQSNCTAPSRCVKCGQGHRSETCTKPPDVLPKCANCNQSHTASYRGCSKCPKSPRSYAAATITETAPQTVRSHLIQQNELSLGQMFSNFQNLFTQMQGLALQISRHFPSQTTS